MKHSIDTISAGNKTLLYLLDATCSACIADVIEFLTVYDKCDTPMLCRILVDENYCDIFNYYLDARWRTLLVPGLTALLGFIVLPVTALYVVNGKYETGPAKLY